MLYQKHKIQLAYTPDAVGDDWFVCPRGLMNTQTNWTWSMMEWVAGMAPWCMTKAQLDIVNKVTSGASAMSMKMLRAAGWTAEETVTQQRRAASSSGVETDASQPKAKAAAKARPATDYPATPDSYPKSYEPGRGHDDRTKRNAEWSSQSASDVPPWRRSEWGDQQQSSSSSQWSRQEWEGWSERTDAPHPKRAA